jgi:hypothetical protein
MNSGSDSRMVRVSQFDDAVEEDDDFLEIGRNSSSNDIFLTLATNFRTEAPALEHLLQNCSPGSTLVVNFCALW